MKRETWEVMILGKLAFNPLEAYPYISKNTSKPIITRNEVVILYDLCIYFFVHNIDRLYLTHYCIVNTSFTNGNM